LLLIIGVIAGLVVVAFRSPSNERKDLQPAIGSAAAQVGSGGTIDLATVAAFAWDRVYLFLAYSGSDGIRDGLGFDWVPASLAESAVFGNLLLASDELSLLVFVRGERDVTGWTILNSNEEPPSIQFDIWAIVDYFAVYQRGDARFTVTDLAGQSSDPVYPAWELSPAIGESSPRPTAGSLQVPGHRWVRFDRAHQQTMSP
jgi:hypothetical protein